MSEEWFLEMEMIYSLLPDNDAAYAGLRKVFNGLLDEVTADADVLLPGCFAKTDYILKQGAFPPDLRSLVNSMRHRLTGKEQHLQQEDFYADFQILCLFIAKLYGVPVPEVLSKNFRDLDIKPNVHAQWGENLRVIVKSWDEEFIQCTSEITDDILSVRYSGQGQLFNKDFSYLSDILAEGMLMNVIRPRIDGKGMLLPELIIVEPDYLVDISTISSCFESYAQSPIVSLLKRLEPVVYSESILMGNMAGELLDGLLHKNNDEPLTNRQLREEYMDSVFRFFRRNATGVLTVSPSKDFHSAAWQQMQNIHHALFDVLPKQHEWFRRDNVIVEPTFFSETLGLQGRMDMLDKDMRMLVEQKAGNAAFLGNGKSTDTPSYREQHYIQMLLYMAIIRYNYGHVYDKNNRQLHSYLLYSKYVSPLVGLGFAPKLIAQALRIRNLYISQERKLQNGGIDQLFDMQVDDFNERGIDDRFWKVYQRPRIEILLNNLQSASELEKAYFIRFYRFVALEHRLSKIGTQTKEHSGFAKAWLLPLSEKLHHGDILINLSAVIREEDEVSHIEHVSFHCPADVGNFRVGDIVVLYNYHSNEEPDIRYSMVFRATITNITPSNITLCLRNPQKNADVFNLPEGMFWCIEHDFLESSYSSLYKGLYSFLCAPKERRDLFLMQRSPVVEEGRVLCGNYGEFNSLQQRIKNSRELFLIIGPPGTGKTSFGMLNTLQEALHEDEAKILVLSYTNRSIDEICSKMYPSIDFIRFGTVFDSSIPYAEKVFSNIVSKCSSTAEIQEILSRNRVVVSTISSALANLSILRQSRFSLCIVDEAGQILEPYLLPILSLCCNDGLPCIKKFVMIGDHKQLPAVVLQRKKDSFVEEQVLCNIGICDCRTSLFERLVSRYQHDPSICHMLVRQGRMHRDIAYIPSKLFYGGRLQEVPLEHQYAPSVTPRITFTDVPVPFYSSSDKVNVSEAKVIVSKLIDIWERNKDSFVPLETVGVIVPYRTQISTIYTLLGRKLLNPEHPLMQITIDTVERYQGSQRKYIIYGFTVQKRYQLRFLTESTFIGEDGVTIDRKLNVAMTRAQEYLFLIGNSKILQHIPLYETLLKYVSSDNIQSGK